MHIDIEKLVARWKDEELDEREALLEYRNLINGIIAFYYNDLITHEEYTYEVNMLDAAYTSYTEKAIYI